MTLARSVDCAQTLDVAEDHYGKGDRATARKLLQSIVATDVEVDDGDSIRAKEQAVYRLAELLTVTKDGEAAIRLLSDVRAFFHVLPKAKATKMVRKLFEHIVQCGVPLKQQEVVCLETVDWARKERRTFLRHRLQLRYVEILFAENRKNDALVSLSALLKEVRRLDDRTLLLDIYLLESKLYYAVMDIQKARAALVSARTTANSIYCPPLSQAEIDLQSGVLHAEEKDKKTAYSYLYEAFEGFHQLGDQARQARRALRYMILSKISTDSPDELSTLLSSKSVLEYKGADVDALRGIADAYNKQDTNLFNEILSKCRVDVEKPGGGGGGGGGGNDTNLLADEVVRRQVNDMYNTLLERHLLKVVSPYNRVQIAYVSSLLKLDAMVVEQKLSQLILDRKLRGIVDQQHRCLIVFDDEATEGSRRGSNDGVDDFYENAADAAAAAATPDQPQTTLYQDALTALECYNTLVTALFDKINGKFNALVEENIAKHKGSKAKEKREKEKDEEDTKRKKRQGGVDGAQDAASMDQGSQKDKLGKDNTQKKDR